MAQARMPPVGGYWNGEIREIRHPLTEEEMDACIARAKRAVRPLIKEIEEGETVTSDIMNFVLKDR